VPLAVEAMLHPNGIYSRPVMRTRNNFGINLIWHCILALVKEAQLLQKGRSTLHPVEKFAKSLKVTRDHLHYTATPIYATLFAKWHKTKQQSIKERNNNLTK